VISIQDNGVGMSPERVRSLLSPAPPSHEGAGLGLALRNVNGRMSAMYGKESALMIESEPGRGTTIRFCVPVAA
jgi:two-component system, LytTR family, sensor histidine kinase LytS